MTRFYRGMLKEGLRPAAALRAAQVSLWKEDQWRAPYYWAAFELQGEWRVYFFGLKIFREGLWEQERGRRLNAWLGGFFPRHFPFVLPPAPPSTFPFCAP